MEDILRRLSVRHLNGGLELHRLPGFCVVPLDRAAGFQDVFGQLRVVVTSGIWDKDTLTRKAQLACEEVPDSTA